MNRVAEWEAAKASGAERYCTGKPCRNGHLAERYTSTGKCVRCDYEKYRRWVDQHLAERAADRRRWRKKNPEKDKATAKRWRAKPEAREWLNAYSAEYYRRDLERNRKRAIAYVANRKAKMAKNGGSFTAEDVGSLYQRQKRKCAGCGKRRKLEVDHIVAIARGGSNDLANLQLLCIPCNRTKGARDAIDWAQDRGLLL
jgi:5-methylcytosine-specific restriction endonuclease McrA